MLEKLSFIHDLANLGCCIDSVLMFYPNMSKMLEKLSFIHVAPFGIG